MIFRRRWLPALYPVVLLAGLVSLPLAAQTAASPGCCRANHVRRSRAGRTPAGLHAAAGQAGQGHRDQPHPQHSQYCRLDLGHRISVAAAGLPWVAGHGEMGAGDLAPALDAGTVLFRRVHCHYRAGRAVIDAISNHYERGYGISVQGWGSWFGDQAKALALALLFGVPILLLFNWIVRRWPGATGWESGWSLCRSWFSSSLIAPLLVPLFYKLEPLEKNHAAAGGEAGDGGGAHGDQYSAGSHVPDEGQREIERGSTHIVTGIGPPSGIVMWDTATDRIPDDEVLFIFGHESGHYVLHHIPEGACRRCARPFLCVLGVRGICRVAGAAVWGAMGHAARSRSRTGFVVLLFAISIAGFLLEPAATPSAATLSTRPMSTGRRRFTASCPIRRKPRSPHSTIWAKPGWKIRIQARSSSSGFTATPASNIAPNSPRTTIRGRTEGMGSFSRTNTRPRG